jgi:hypothetical protein
MCGPLRGAIIGGLLFQGLARSQRQAAALAASGEIDFAPNHHSSGWSKTAIMAIGHFVI